MSTAQQQQALIVPAPHADFVLGSREIPTPESGEVLVKIMSAALNPVNYAARVLGIMIDEYPAVLGNDIAGVVEQVGAGVQGFRKGDRVCVLAIYLYPMKVDAEESCLHRFAATLGGGFQQYVPIPAAVLIHIPEKTSFDEVATIPVTFSTACVGLFAPAPIGLGLNPTFSWDKPQQGASALVLGGGTSTGQYAIQLLKFLGFARIVVYASTAHVEYLRKLGGTEFIDRNTVPIEALAASPALAGDKRVAVAYDAAFHSTVELNAAYDCVADGGKVCTVNPFAPLHREGRGVAFVRVQGYYAGPDVLPPKTAGMKGYAATPEHSTFGRLIIENLPELIEKAAITANRVEVLPGGISAIAAGLERLKQGGANGVKLVVHPQETQN
ncbi:chaperonin 10-like protein [Mycena rebaudengoi]|nr:chaperonin 10-like protein [Mycena rebaudengoi]